MWKQFVALARGRRYEAAEALLDRDAHVILRQQIRDAAATLERARLAVALAMAQEREEGRRADGLSSRLADLEERAVAALDAGKDGLAREAAEAIARLEADLDAARRAGAVAGAEIARLRRIVSDAEERLRDLRRGQRLAEAAGRVGRLRASAPGEVASSLRDAEATLARLRGRQDEADAVERALAEMARDADPAALARRLAEAGCGAPPPHSADAVLKRLDERRKSRA
ncbi:PspA/IM30 family protein [Antarcticirhabdus aurantiaca]|uniref:PspA/IM30 family protein n=1 Tax=Antarcticirhabdus aurantiaca TaxID=2606717 RepID=A0ACD4NN90_9HYPH|nr:PspA/IM30 family protein [Antarcticirhabdus aurantiaca]WAJ28331.1 PspA/IM30 family protein [Jeongeuplla avenae]